MTAVTFRDFAAGIMKGDVAAAATTLESLLGLDATHATAAAAHFHERTTAVGPAFMGKAMGLRTALASGSDADLRAILVDCFALADAPLAQAVGTLRAT